MMLDPDWLYFTALSRTAQRTCSRRSGSATTKSDGPSSSKLERRSARRASHVLRTTGSILKMSCAGVTTPASSRDATRSWLTMRRSRSDWWAMVSRSARAASSRAERLAQPLCKGSNARQRRLQVVRHAAQEVGLDGGHAGSARQPGCGPCAYRSAWSIALAACRPIARTDPDRTALARPPFPQGKQDGTQFLARGAVHHDERAPWTPMCRLPRVPGFHVGRSRQCRPSMEIAQGLGSGGRFVAIHAFGSSASSRGAEDGELPGGVSRHAPRRWRRCWLQLRRPYP